jgi:hypothetical protein
MKLLLSTVTVGVALIFCFPVDAATPLDTVVSLDGITQSAGTRVRILNASPDVGPIDLYIAQNREAENVAFEEISESAPIATASFVVRVTRTGETEPLIETGITFGQGVEKTLILTGFADGLELDELESSGPESSPSTSYLRFFHASPDTDAVDLAVTGQGVLHADVEFREGSEYEALDSGTYDLEVRVTGEEGAILEIPGVWLQGAAFYTVYLTGLEADIGEPDDTNYYFVPAAARNRGAKGSFFVTDLDVLNPNPAAATCTMMWLPRNTDNSSPRTSDDFTVESGEVMRFEDVLGSVFGFDDESPASGALGLECDSPGVTLFSRTYNNTEEGTYGQGLPGIDADDLIQAGQIKRIMFMSENDDLRSNLGIMNGTASPITVKWRRYLPDGTLWASSFRDLPPWGNTQINRIFEDAAPVAGAYIEIWTETFGGAFATYGSALDNQTSDPTTVAPQ